MMDLLLMRSLLAVAEHGAITEAAAALGLSQPALSRRIQQLEDDFGTPLLQRSRRGVVLTEMGRLVQAEARVLVERYGRLRESVRAHLQLEQGSVRMGGGATAVAYLMPQAIAEFARKHPGVVFQLKEAGSREIERDVLDGRLELGVITLPVHSAELETTPLRDDRIVPVASAQHPLSSVKQLRLSALSGQSVVGFEAGSAIRQLIDSALREAGVEVHVVMELRSVAAILQMVATTDSIAFISERALASAGRRVKRLQVRGLKVTRQLAVIRRRDHPVSPAAGAFVQTLLAS